MRIIKQIQEHDDGEYQSALFTVTIDDDETIEEVIAWEFAAEHNTSDYDCTGRWYAREGQVIDTCCDMLLIRQTAVLDI